MRVLNQRGDIGRPLCNDQAVFGEVTSQRVYDLSTLPDQKIASAKHDRARLLVLTLHGGKAHGGALGCFANRFCIGHIVFLAFHKGLYIGRWNQTHCVTQLANLTSPVMGAGAGFHRYQARRLLSKESQHIVTTQLFAENNNAASVCAMCLKNMFRQV
ncbi:uncharacterized protein NK6_d_81 (plasmid) [Bradyrhizobium diazoefficiens]|uniref:Uncharacterized protein n=1 Tax=Bradyrhizobium diazoefficiens TaxID=1355477 RepID=A0A0E3VY19_9BRAD|nr:uncharacterized protein NK6_d_81 [Bradyrhizobium diazoefficiens]